MKYGKKERNILIVENTLYGMLMGILLAIILLNCLSSDIVSYMTGKALYDEVQETKTRIQKESETCVSTKEMNVFCVQLKNELQKIGYKSNPHIESGYQCGIVIDLKSTSYEGDQYNSLKIPQSGALPIHLGGFKNMIDSSARIVAQDVAKVFDEKIRAYH